ncbi:CoA-transferase family III [Eremomyces bilateralis CBS 781.70]|uniref:CoA-transferase family III n=1 Tax=Eremomyces bilateralis CBS 781.70 TaxID=1392243 RepID=A0A6G1G7D9_9PEZI|nr:CoA-transferase family III [Eremomyces bilateralis CBS 781.70]KAF1814005.1 CoA-transferase family III [Eremomyces bilateralis CBS 781.70]
MSSASAPPLKGVRVLEFGGLAPGPFCGLLLADFGADVLRLDRATSQTHTDIEPPPTGDWLTRHKSSIAVNIKTPRGVSFVKALLPHVDVIIDPFRPGVLEKAGLCPTEVMLSINPRLIVARMTGFRRDGKYKDMAGHDINYIAVSGVLSMLGRKGEKPLAPGNILGDFAGGGAMCFLAVLLALIAREKDGKGQVVEANMVDGAAYLATMPRLSTKTPTWGRERGTNMLDGGSPFYDTYETKDGKYMAVGALEPQFFAELMKGLNIDPKTFPGSRDDRKTWPYLVDLFTKTFKSKTRAEWEVIFDGTDACCTPVLTQQELEEKSFDQRPPVTLRRTPGYAQVQNASSEPEPAIRAAKGQGAGVEGEGWSAEGLGPSVGGEKVLEEWVGWKKGKQYEVENGGLAKISGGLSML